MPEFDTRENLQPAAEGYDSRLKAALKSIKNQGVHSQTEFYSRLLDAQKFGSGELYHQLAIIASKAGQHKSTAYCLRQADKSFAPYQDHARYLIKYLLHAYFYLNQRMLFLSQFLQHLER